MYVLSLTVARKYVCFRIYRKSLKHGFSALIQSNVCWSLTTLYCVTRRERVSALTRNNNLLFVVSLEWCVDEDYVDLIRFITWRKNVLEILRDGMIKTIQVAWCIFEPAFSSKVTFLQYLLKTLERLKLWTNNIVALSWHF